MPAKFNMLDQNLFACKTQHLVCLGARKTSKTFWFKFSIRQTLLILDYRNTLCATSHQAWKFLELKTTFL